MVAIVNNVQTLQCKAVSHVSSLDCSCCLDVLEHNCQENRFKLSTTSFVVYIMPCTSHSHTKDFKPYLVAPHCA